MNPIELLQKRYATKKYNPNKEIDSEKVEILKEALRLSPSSLNIQPWKFTFVQSTEIKAKLAAASMYNEDRINEAGLLIVFSVIDNLELFIEIITKELPERDSDWVKNLKDTMPETIFRTWLEKQVYVALGIGLSTSIQLGLDSTPMEGITPDKYGDILGMKDYRPLFAMAVGYAATDDFKRLEVAPKLRRSLNDVIQSI